MDESTRITENKNVCLSFLGNALFDTRAFNFYKSFKAKGFNVEVISFDWLGSTEITPEPGIKIYRLSKKKSSLFFYSKFFLLLAFNLFKSRASLFFAEDIYTLPLVCIAARIKRAKVVYDSRELFGFLAGLKDRKKVQRLLALLEKIFIKYADYIVVTGDMDGEFLTSQYKLKKTVTVRNLPFYRENIPPVDLRKKFGIPANKRILLYQGVILHGRGLRHVFDFLKNFEDAVLVILGDGEHKKYYQELAASTGVGARIIFGGKIPQSELLNYSAGADIGVSLIENLSVSYYYALPNKMFEYIMAGLPVAVSALPQMERIVNEYGVGISINLDEVNEINKRLAGLLNNEEALLKFRGNCLKAARELNWDNEINRLFNVLN